MAGTTRQRGGGGCPTHRRKRPPPSVAQARATSPAPSAQGRTRTAASVPSFPPPRGEGSGARSEATYRSWVGGLTPCTARPQPTSVHLRNPQPSRASEPHFKKLMPGALRPLIFSSSPRAARSRPTVCEGSWGSRESSRGGPKREPRQEHSSPALHAAYA